MSVSENNVIIKLSHELDERGEYNAFTSISVDIHVHGSKAGFLTGVIVNRQRIPERMFLSAMDGHSADLQYVAVSLFEPRLGRTKLVSLRDGGDDDEFDFMYIEEMHIDDQYKRDGNSDVGACALRLLLHHPYVKGQAFTNTSGSCWSVSSCVYQLDPREAMSREIKERIETEELRDSEMGMAAMVRGMENQPETEESLRAKEEKSQMMDKYARLDANQFLRNGFYEDATMASQGGDGRFLVAAHQHWDQPLKSHTEATAVKFTAAPPEIRPPVGKDAEILELTKRRCQDCGEQGCSSIQTATNNERSSAYRADVSCLMSEGGSLARSNALHAACALNDPSIVQCILQMDPTSSLEARDVHNSTPLMMAAVVASGKKTIHGLPLDQPVIDILVAAGADKGAVDSKGLTAYGNFQTSLKDYDQMMQALCGNPVQSSSKSNFIPGLVQLEAKLMPPNGPTRADRTGGNSAEPGFVDYGEEDSDDDDDDYGDY